MEDSSGERGPPSTPQLLNLIRDEREWTVTREVVEDGGAGSTSATATAASPDHPEEDDYSKLELRLCLPGAQDDERTPPPPGEKGTCTALSLGSGCFPSHPKLAASAGASATAATWAKRGFLATVGAKAQGYCRQEEDSEGCGNELTLGGENMAGETKKGCCCPPSSSHDSDAGPAVHRGDVLPVVGWPPVRSFRRNLANASSSKQSLEQQQQNDDEASCDKAKQTCKRSPLIKINMDGIPIGRKINLSAYDSYQKLSSAVQDLFCGFLDGTGRREYRSTSPFLYDQIYFVPAQKDESRGRGAEEKMFSGLLDGTGEYTLVCEDSEGGRTLVGHLPWNVFVSTAKRLRVMESSELPHGLEARRLSSSTDGIV
ncbi:auxin-responsive protein IAA18 isoform X1 [Zea mays]|uniref:auxin-responsive protein IAA18 isoform X1 n=1 Tax=Zea mays TaxID=4577 RepID=UPI000C6C7F32|nr:uncharacterized protein LOC100272504 isoform X1 [Zea mays]XP_023156005.1 uncharacterized protein LOC100272504 isoform X1 [Zea mays]XP_035815306.1 uncharacterized protein LOC100272504 isoform X1 [Zea mays]|eukprot:XP_023156004.1 uncharacterized protein LOC100272504 isoform X1 [Zea mays]